jgi:uncharacterized membrane protein YeaQ/YmgE (transglycosylase-associated protein family)
MSLIAYILLAALSGLFVGALARLFLPGRDPMSLLETAGVGMAGSLVAGLISYYVFDHNGGGLILSVLVAMVFVWLIRRSRQGTVNRGSRRGSFGF